MSRCTTGWSQRKEYALSKESLLYPKIKEWILASYPDAWLYRTTDTFRVGIPDIIACVNGLFLAIEVKANEEKKLMKIQEYELGQIEGADGIGMAIKGDTLYWRGREIQWKEVTLEEVLIDAPSC